METKVVRPTKKNIELACELLKRGEVVAVPTETVYGLAADSKNAEAIKKIFEAKGRPADNPLIVHISNMDMLTLVAKSVTADARVLADKFWPGPLTMILPKADGVPDEVTAGLDSVGVRMPSNKIALEIIEKSTLPFAAPSANLSGKPSPTTAKSVFEDMNGRIPMIIDGGKCDVGVESTVISMLGETPTILRPGIISKEEIELALGKPVALSRGVKEAVEPQEKVLSPGMKYRHYAPSAKVILVKGTLEKFAKYINSKKTDGVFAMVFDGEEYKLATKSISYGKKDDEGEQARRLFETLRTADRRGAKVVYVRCPEDSGVSLATYNRLIRAAGFDIIEL